MNHATAAALLRVAAREATQHGDELAARRFRSASADHEVGRCPTTGECPVVLEARTTLAAYGTPTPAGAVCSCSGHHVVVIHDPGTHCGDDQHDRLWHAVDGSGADDATGAVTAVLDALRRDARA